MTVNYLGIVFSDDFGGKHNFVLAFTFFIICFGFSSGLNSSYALIFFFHMHFKL